MNNKSTSTEIIEVPSQIAEEVKLFVNLLLTGEIDSLRDLLEKAGFSLTYNLETLWYQVIDAIANPMTQAIFRKRSQLVNFDGHLATIAMTSGQLLHLSRGKIPDLEAAFYQVIGTRVEVKLVLSNNEDFLPREQPVIAVENKQNNQLTTDQETALEKLKNFTYSNDKFFRLTGYAGTGKTFLITHYIQWLLAEGLNFVAACPTNKAAKGLTNLAEAEGLDLEVKTVAQLLGQQPELDEETGKELFISQGDLDWSGYGVIIIDEFSMVNQDNFRDIVHEVNNSLLSKVLFVGDAAQLPPVGEKEPIVSSSELIQQSATLTKVVRYDGELAKVAESIRSNKKYSRSLYPFATTRDQTILCLSQSQWFARAISLFTTEEFQKNPDYIRFLAWRNKTVDSLNNFVRSQLWGLDAPDYLPGDRLIARRPLFRIKPGQKGKNKWRIVINNSEEATVIKAGELCEQIFRGQIYQYWKLEVQPDEGKSQTLSILHPDSKEIHREQIKYFASKKQWQDYYDLSRMFDDVGYAYALTTHKAQGSTIDYVFLDIADMKGCRDRQKLQYTALTRAKTQVLIYS
ncbi:MAG: AAA family ATPase [Xenococcus sp. (in: cyanobacteria)]